MVAKKGEKANYNAQDFPKADAICRIIAACRKAGVSTFKFGALEVSFSSMFEKTEHTRETGHSSQPVAGPAPTPAVEVLGKTIQAQEQAQTASHEEQEIQTREDQIAELLVTDPGLAEDLIAEGELEGESTDGSEQGEALD